MEAYPLEYAAHEFPLIVLSGLTEEQNPTTSTGSAIESALPLVTNHNTKELLQDFLSFQAKESEWNIKSGRGKNTFVGYFIKAAGRKYILPPRRPTSTSQDLYVPRHSTLSPLTPDSPIYPDGILTPKWFAKHQRQVPCMLIAFFDIQNDPNTNTINDNLLKTDINNIKSMLQQSGHRTKLTCILLADETVQNGSGIDERFNIIRKATNLDSKTGLFFLPATASRTDITTFVTSIMASLQPLCIDYYRDLTKHCRRKKSRSSIPSTPPSNKSGAQPLSEYCWTIRYNIKLAVFAEFRQEMNAACRHYTAALESLMNSEGPFEMIVSWNPRFDEARLLADTVAFRIIRCLLWSGLYTTATQSWVNYRDRMNEIIERRGKGAANHSWEAWEGNWAAVMADLIQQAEIPDISVTDSIDMTTSMILDHHNNPIYLEPEKDFEDITDLAPWNKMHHIGYWMRLSAKSAKRRQRKANAIPEEDRINPAQSSTAAAAHRSKLYDTFLCLGPHDETHKFDHSTDIIRRLEYAADEFEDRKQNRFTERLKLDIGREHLRKKKYRYGLEILKEIWYNISWRKEHWWIPLFELNRTLLECARQTGDLVSTVSAAFELYNSNLRLMRDMKIDLMNIGKTIQNQTHNDTKDTQETEKVELIEGTEKTAEKKLIRLNPDSVLSFLSTNFVFDSTESHVGDNIRVQFQVFSSAHQNTAPITISEIRCQFKQNRHELIVTDSGITPPATYGNLTQNTPKPIEAIDLVTSAELSDDLVIYKSSSNLTFPPGRKVIFCASLDIKDPGELELLSIDLEIEADDFIVSYSTVPDQFLQPIEWYYESNEGNFARTRLVQKEPWTIEIRPKPPKLSIELIDLAESLYTNEMVILKFKIKNEEEEEVMPILDIRLFTQNSSLEFSWKENSNDERISEDNNQQLQLAKISPGDFVTKFAFFEAPSIPRDITLETKLEYSLPSEPSIPLTKTTSLNLPITAPFEANYVFTPRPHPEIWPSFFSFGSSVPGLLQRWNLNASIASFATESLIIQSVSLEIDNKPSSVVVNLLDYGIIEDDDRPPIAPKTIARGFNFVLDTTRPSSVVRDGPRTVTLSALLHITWKRLVEDAPCVTSTLLVSTLTLPPLEPRALASVMALPFSSTSISTSTTTSTPTSIPTHTSTSTIGMDIPLHLLTLTLENPTAHPLTFDVSAPSSESIAFAGVKQGGITLVPYSRSEVKYRLIKLGKTAPTGEWVHFGVKVVDRWFVREVDVLAGEGVEEADGKDGGLKIWVSGSDDE